MSKPLLLTDLDGTLLARDERLDLARFDDLAGLFTERGGEAVIATARPPHEVAGLVRGSICSAICLDGGLHIECSHGQIVRVLSETLLAPQDAQRAASSLRAACPHAEVLFFGGSEADFAIYVLPGSSPSGCATRVLDMLGDVRPRLSIGAATSLDAIPVRAVALVLSAPSQRVAERVRLTTPGIQWLHYSETRLPLPDPPDWLEAVPTGMTKGVAAARLAKDSYPIVAAGNGINDLDMLAAATVSFCPNDAQDAVLRLADHVLPVAGGVPFLDALIRHLRKRPSTVDW